MMEESFRVPMEKTGRIIRRSIYTFLQNYHYFTITAALLAFPFSASILLSQVFLPSSSSPLLMLIYHRLKSLFDAAGFPSSSELFTVLSAKLSQTIFSAIFTLPFALTFFLLAKASVIQALNQQKSTRTPSFSSVVSLYSPLFLTYVFNSFLLVSANASAFSLLFFAFNFFSGFGFSSSNLLLFLSAAGAVLYSIILANALIVCNLGLILSGMERSGGYLAILKACLLVRGRTSTALSLALPVNIALAGIEALFQYRIVKLYYAGDGFCFSMIIEGMFIAYLYAVFVVLDIIISCMFFETCKTGYWIDQEDRYAYRIEIAEDDRDTHKNFKNSVEIP